MEIRLDALRERPRRVTFKEPVETFPALGELVSRGALAIPGEIEADLVATLAGDLVEVEGTLSCTVVQACSRCLQPAEQHLNVQVALTFTRHALPEGEAVDERELTEDEIGLIAFEGDSIELDPPIEQELLMALPQHPLCRDDCAGLCQVCGADLNLRRCGCAPPVFHGGLAALKGFKVRPDQSG